LLQISTRENLTDKWDNSQNILKQAAKESLVIKRKWNRKKGLRE
jgi:hypothetical protein